MIQTRAKNKVIIGSRESRLAVLQSEMVRDYIKEQHPGLDVEILTMKTTGRGNRYFRAFPFGQFGTYPYRKRRGRRSSVLCSE